MDKQIPHKATQKQSEKVIQERDKKTCNEVDPSPACILRISQFLTKCVVNTRPTLHLKTCLVIFWKKNFFFSKCKKQALKSSSKLEASLPREDVTSMQHQLTRKTAIF